MKKQIIIAALFGFFLLIISIVGLSRAGKNFEITNNSGAISQSPNNNSADFKKGGENLSGKSGEVSLIAVGDIMLSRNVAKKIRDYENPDYPFLKVKDYLKSADMVFGNLESPITAGREIKTGEMIFRADPGVEDALKNANFSILSLANNHTPNFGEKGLKDTFQYLEKAGIKYAGAGQNDSEAYAPAYLESKGIKFAFLAYNDSGVVPPDYKAGENRAGTAFMDIDKMTKAIKEAMQNADFVIVSLHSGNEYNLKPNSLQVNFAHEAIDAGAEMVIGHHPHVVQTAEKYKGKYIFYSLGNFVFDQMWSQETREGLAVKIFFSKSGADKIELAPVLIEDYSQPRLMDGAEKEKMLKRLDISLKAFRQPGE